VALTCWLLTARCTCWTWPVNCVSQFSSQPQQRVLLEAECILLGNVSDNAYADDMLHIGLLFQMGPVLSTAQPPPESALNLAQLKYP
jgi:hypothetical protein